MRKLVLINIVTFLLIFGSFSLLAKEIDANENDVVQARSGSKVVVHAGAKVIISAGAEVYIQDGAKVILQSKEVIQTPEKIEINDQEIADKENKTTKSVAGLKYQTNNRGLSKLLPDISVIGSFAGAYYTSDTFDNVGHDPSRTGFTLQEIEMAIQSVVDPYFRADVFLGFHEFGVEVEEAYLSTLHLSNGLKLKAGKFLLPFGRQNQKHLEQWSFADNTLANKNIFGGEGLSELGVYASYLLPTKFYFNLEGSFSNGDNEESFNGNRKEDFLYNLRLSSSFDLSKNTTALIGVSGLWGYNQSGFGNNTDIYGADLMIRWKPNSYRSLTWQFEYLMRRMEEPGVLQTDGGFYTYLDYQFLKRWHIGLRYDQLGIPEDVITEQYRITPMITFEPTEFSRLRFQYEYDKTDGEEVDHAAIMQVQFNIGPHGAHKY